ncbi:MAG: InlB B-repeat-containing protein, partial [Lachnospiraceae bacterium]|nr:InlB B-repeat-containing protein [Lachnospiraceae bacterium]
MKNKSRIVIAVTLAIMMMLSSVLTSFAATNHYIPDEYGNIDVINENIPEYEDNEFLGEENDEKATYSLVKSLSDLDESKNYILVTQDGTSNKTFGDGETINKAYVALTSKDSFDEEGKTYLPWYTIKADGSDNKLPEKIEIPSEEKDSLLWNIQINQDSPKTCILFCDNGNLVADIDSLKVEKETTATELNYSESSNSFSLTISSENRINTSGSRRAFRCNNTSTSSFYLFEESSEETESYTVTVTCGENGTVTPGTIELEKGESQQFTIEAATDYEIDDVKLDGTSVKASVSSGKYTVSNITADHTLAVTFRVKQETTDAERVDSVVTGKYVIVSEGNFALSQAVHLGYLNQNSYEYLGYYGKSVTITNDKIELSSLTKDLVWDISESGGKLTIKNLEGKVLGATYQSNGLSDNSQKGTLATGIDDTWTLSSGILKSDKSGKSLRYDKDSDHVSSDQIREGKANLFTIRSTGGTIEFYKIADKNVSEIDDINNVTVKTEVSPDEGGTVTPAGSISLIKGSDVKFTFDSNTGFRLSKVEDGTTDVTNEVDANAYVKSSVSENTTVKATFELEVTKYKVAFDLNGHGSNAPQTVETGNDGKVSKPSPDPTDASYDFGGWYKEATCQNEWNFATDTASEDTTLYAKWTLKQDEATYIVFTSDVHNKVKGESLSRLSTILNNLKSKGIDFDYLGFCGDMGDAQVSEDNFWNYASQVMDLVEKSGITGIYTTGNHEYSPGNIDRTSNQTAKRYIRNAEAVSKDQFSIYCLGAASGTQEITTAQIDALSAYLSTHKTLPVFVMSHYPLHSAKEGFETRNTGNAGQVITLLNQYPNVIFLWGHNHTLSDPKYDITDFSDINGAEINFKYMAAGCLSDSEYGAGSASVEGKALLVKIENGKMTFSYIDDAEDVPPTPVTKGDFKRSTSKAITAGNQYLFVGQSGSSETTFYALKNETLETSKSSSQKHTLTNLKSLADSFSLTSDEESAGIIWTAESVSGGYVLSNDGKYLANSTDNTVTLTTDKNNAKVFTNLSSVKYGGGINTTYYFNYSSGDSEAYIYEKTGDAPSPGTTYTITATAGSHGAVSPESKTVNEGEDATFTITPDTGYEIDTVTVDGAAVTPTTDTTYKFTDVRAEHTLNVTFKEIYVPIPQYTITATAGANGKVSPESKTVNEGEDATFTITPDTGYEIDTVTVDGAAVTPTSDTTYKFTDVRAEHTLRVTFKEIYVPIPQYTITATAGPNGAVSPSSKTVNEGEDATFTITPDTGYEVDQITVDGSEVTYSGGSTYTFTDVDKNHTLRVTFKEIYVPIPQYKITATAGANGKVSPESKTV